MVQKCIVFLVSLRRRVMNTLEFSTSRIRIRCNWQDDRVVMISEIIRGGEFHLSTDQLDLVPTLNNLLDAIKQKRSQIIEEEAKW